MKLNNIINILEARIKESILRQNYALAKKVRA